MRSWLRNILLVLSFVLIGVLFLHSFTSINQDIGRHLKFGELILKTHIIPHTNLVSYTDPNHPFIDHHWLSEVIFYVLYQTVGLKGLIIFKAVLFVLIYLLLYKAVRPQNLWVWLGALLISLSVMERSEVRPEIFSFLFLAIFIFILFRVKNSQLNYKYLWLLPVIELLWVNMHIYFFVGLLLYGAFFIQSWLQKRQDPKIELKRYFVVGLILGLVTLLNPRGIYGALYPFNIFKEYGYDIVENKSVFFIAHYFNVWAFNLKAYIFSLFIAAFSLLLQLKNWRNRIFELIAMTFFIYAGFSMIRNLALYSLFFAPFISSNLSIYADRLKPKFKRFELAGYVLASIGFLLLIYLIISNTFYRYTDSPKRFGLDVPQAAEQAVGFIKRNHIKGPLFNNFDIGSYLIWKLYPEEKVFTDGRPEAYTIDFWNNTYKAIQADYSKWHVAEDRYAFNYVIMAHGDMTEWARNFLKNISRDHDWVMVYLNENIVIFVKRNQQNQAVIDKYGFDATTIAHKIDDIEAQFVKSDDAQFRSLGSYFYSIGWYQAAAQVYADLVRVISDDAYGYQGQAYSLMALNQRQAQHDALPLLQKTLDLGLVSSQTYIYIAIIYANDSDLLGANRAIDKALELEPDNALALQIKQKLNSVTR